MVQINDYTTSVPKPPADNKRQTKLTFAKVSTNSASSSRNDDNPAPTVSFCSSSSVSTNQSSYPNLNTVFGEDNNFEVQLNDKLSKNLAQYLTTDLEKISSLQNTTQSVLIGCLMDQFSSIIAGLPRENKYTTSFPRLFLPRIFKLDNPTQIPEDEDLVLLPAFVLVFLFVEAPIGTKSAVYSSQVVIEDTLTLIDFIHMRENEFMHFVDLIFHTLLCILLYCLFSFYQAKKFLSDEHIWKKSTFKSTYTSVAKEWDVFNNLREQYTKYSSLQSNSNLAKTLLDVQSAEDNIAEQVKVLILWKTEASIGINELVKSLNEKREKILDALKSLVCLQAKVTSKELPNSLRHRIKQMTLTKNFAANYCKYFVQ